jgi:hypothetical protein
MKHFLHLEINKYETMVEALEALQKSSYTHSFKIKDGQAVCLETGEIIQPQEMTIVEFHRFEGDSDPSDMSVVFAVECENGLNGSIVDAYGTYADNELNLFLQKVKIAERQS